MSTELLLTIIGIIITTIGVIITATVGRKSLREAIENSIRWIKRKTRAIYIRITPRQSRAELIDIAEIIETTLSKTEEILKGHHTIINYLNNDVPLKEEYITEHGKKIEEMTKLNIELYLKINSIKQRKWRGIETTDSNKKPKKKI